MVTWLEFATGSPELAKRIRERFDAGTNKTIATLRLDGSPRISGTELEFDDQRVTLGMMPGSRKLADVLRDPRVAIHSPTLEPPARPSDWAGDAKLSGRLVQMEPPVSNGVADAAFFTLDIREAVLTFVDVTETQLVIQSWISGRGFAEVRRA